MVNHHRKSRKLTYQVDLPGGRERLRELVLYISSKAAGMPRFGAVKLNKIIWRADFGAFLARGTPVSGRPYQRLQFGPVPIEVPVVLAEMAQDELIGFDLVTLGINPDGSEIVERRLIPKVEPSLQWFSADDLQYVDHAIAHYWTMTGSESSDDSHGVAWNSRENGDPIPYESALLSDKTISDRQLAAIAERVREQGWKSL